MSNSALSSTAASTAAARSALETDQTVGPPISVIIPVLNEITLLRDCVNAAWEAGADQLIVTDGGSRDGTPELARQLGCEVVESATGRGRQLRAGVERAHGAILVLLHVDAVLDPTCLNQIRNAADVAAWGCFEHRIQAEGRRYRWLEQGNRWRARTRQIAYGDQVMWLTRQLCNEIGGIPDEPLMEDVILSDRLRRHGPPAVLPGPVAVSPRHWKRLGVVRTTIRNWVLFGLFRAGVSPARIARWYR